MSRSGYTEDWDFDTWSMIKYRGQVASAIRGRRGQSFLRELLEALDALPEKRLITHELRQGGEVCAIGALGARRGTDMDALDPEDAESIAAAFGVARQLVCEIEYENDECSGHETPEVRWSRMRAWVVRQLKPAPDGVLTPHTDPTATGSEP